MPVLAKPADTSIARLAKAPKELPAVLSATGEFRALTAPEHYGRNGVSVEDNRGSNMIDKPQRPKRPAQKRSGIPQEARDWITEQLLAEQTPTGPEVGRQFRVDASTGRRWVRQVRENLETAARGNG